MAADPPSIPESRWSGWTLPGGCAGDPHVPRKARGAGDCSRRVRTPQREGGGEGANPGSREIEQAGGWYPRVQRA